jgi:NifU-like protein
MGWDYSEKVIDHFLNPRNVGEIKDADGVGEVGSIACGDMLKLFLKVDENGVITDATFQTFGCGSAIASSSVLTELIKGRTVEEASQVTNQEIVDQLGGLPPAKMHCSVMGREALEAAIADYRGEFVTHDEDEEESAIVCHCYGVTYDQVRRAVVENSLESVEDITNYTKAGGGCQSCHVDLQDILDEIKAAGGESLADDEPAAEPAPLTNLQKMVMVQQTIDQVIQPALMRDGGGIELVDIVGNVVHVRLTGACASCAVSEMTMRHFVEEKLRQEVTPELEVREVK